jgi:hypothetical protein
MAAREDPEAGLKQHREPDLKFHGLRVFAVIQIALGILLARKGTSYFSFPNGYTLNEWVPKKQTVTARCCARC